MASQLYLFTGEDSLRLDRELARWTQGFQDKHGQESVLVFRGERSASDVLSQLQGGGLFSQERMVVIYGVPTEKGSSSIEEEAIEPLVEQLKRLDLDRPEDLWVICVSSAPDKRKSAYKWFKKETTIKTFDHLTPAKLRSWLRKEYPELLTADQYDQVIQRVGTDTRRVLSEIDKIQWWRRLHNDTRVTESELRLLVSGEGEADVFAFVHLVFSQPDKAIRLIDEVRDSGSYWAMFWGSATWGLRILVPMIDGVQQGLDSKTMAKQLKAPPFGVAKMMKLAQRQAERDGGQMVREFFRQMVDLEYAAKTGRFDADALRGQLKKTIIQTTT